MWPPSYPAHLKRPSFFEDEQITAEVFLPCQCGHEHHTKRCSRSCPCSEYEVADPGETPTLTSAYYQDARRHGR